MPLEALTTHITAGVLDFAAAMRAGGPVEGGEGELQLAAERVGVPVVRQVQPAEARASHGEALALRAAVHRDRVGGGGSRPGHGALRRRKAQEAAQVVRPHLSEELPQVLRGGRVGGPPVKHHQRGDDVRVDVLLPTNQKHQVRARKHLKKATPSPIARPFIASSFKGSRAPFAIAAVARDAGVAVTVIAVAVASELLLLSLELYL